MASPSTSFQPPLPTYAPPPPACPPPPPPPLPPSKPPADSGMESLPAHAGSLMTVQPHSPQDAHSLAMPSSHSTPSLSHPPLLQSTSGDPLPQSATNDMDTKKTGERPKSLKEASLSGGRQSTIGSPTKEKSPQPTTAAPAVRSPMNMTAPLPQLPLRYKIPKNNKAPTEARAGSSGARSASASRVDGSLVKQGREGRRKPERSQR